MRVSAVLAYFYFCVIIVILFIWSEFILLHVIVFNSFHCVCFCVFCEFCLSQFVFSCDYTFESQNFNHISQEAKDFISNLLVLHPEVSFYFYLGIFFEKIINFHDTFTLKEEFFKHSATKFLILYQKREILYVIFLPRTEWLRPIAYPILGSQIIG